MLTIRVLLQWNIPLYHSSRQLGYLDEYVFLIHENMLIHTKALLIIYTFLWELLDTYCIRPNYCTYSYKRTVKQFRSLQITASVLLVYFLIKAYVVGTHLNCIALSMQFKWVLATYACIKKIRKKKSHIHHQISLSSDLFYCVSLEGTHILPQMSVPSNFEKPKCTVR